MKVKKPIVRTAAFTLSLLAAMSVPAFAITPSYQSPNLPKISDVNVHVELPSGFWDEYFEDHPIELPEITETATLDTPVITKSTYSHNAVLSNTLQLVWDEVDGAESYEVEITKADGSSKIYAADTPCLLIKAGSDDFITGCPKVYVAETSTWTAATVSVRALAGDDASSWSETAKISCNALFHTK